MKYVDYPENLPNVLVEKLNQEYKNKNLVKVQQTEVPISMPSSINTLTDAQLTTLAQNLSLNYANAITYLVGYLDRSPNRNERDILNRIINTLTQNKTAIATAFNVSGVPSVSSAGETRRCLKLKILSTFYDILFNSNLLLSKDPSNFGLYQTNQSNINALFDFLSLVI